MVPERFFEIPHPFPKKRGLENGPPPNLFGGALAENFDLFGGALAENCDFFGGALAEHCVHDRHS
jgi:hypothetical protein